MDNMQGIQMRTYMFIQELGTFDNYMVRCVIWELNMRQLLPFIRQCLWLDFFASFQCLFGNDPPFSRVFF